MRTRMRDYSLERCDGHHEKLDLKLRKKAWAGSWDQKSIPHTSRPSLTPAAGSRTLSIVPILGGWAHESQTGTVPLANAQACLPA
jgi:hypothetical protein